MILPNILRAEDFNNSGWEQYRKKWNKYISCSIRGKTGDPESFQHVCYSCASTHPDSTHAPSWSHAPSGNHKVEHCWFCAGLVLKIKSDTKGTTRTYYKIGAKEPSTHPYECFDNRRDRDTEELRDRQSVCEHEYLEVFSDAQSVQEAAFIKADLESQPVVLQIMTSDMGGSTITLHTLQNAQHIFGVGNAGII